MYEIDCPFYVEARGNSLSPSWFFNSIKCLFVIALSAYKQWVI